MSGQRALVASDSAVLRGHRRAHLTAGSEFAARTSLGWIPGLLPREEGIAWFITGFSNITEVTNHALFGILMVNPFHNVVHLALGAFWLLAAFALTPAGTEGMNIAICGICLLTTVLGWLGLFSLLSIPSG